MAGGASVPAAMPGEGREVVGGDHGQRRRRPRARAARPRTTRPSWTGSRRRWSSSRSPSSTVPRSSPTTRASARALSRATTLEQLVPGEAHVGAVGRLAALGHPEQAGRPITWSMRSPPPRDHRRRGAGRRAAGSPRPAAATGSTAAGPSDCPSGSNSSGGAPMLNPSAQQVLPHPGVGAAGVDADGEVLDEAHARRSRAPVELLVDELLQPGVEGHPVGQVGGRPRDGGAARVRGARPASCRQLGPCTSASAQNVAQRSSSAPCVGTPRVGRRPARRRRVAPSRCSRAVALQRPALRRGRTSGSPRQARAASAARRTDRRVGRADLVDADEQRAAPPAARRVVGAGGDRRDRRRARAAGSGPRPDRRGRAIHVADGADVGEVADAPALRRPGRRHLDGHAPLPQAVRAGGSARAHEERGGRAAVERRRGRGCRAGGPAGGGRSSPRSVPSSRREPARAVERLGGAGAHHPHRSARRARPSRRGSPRSVAGGAVCHWPSVSNQPSSMPQASVRHPSGPLPRALVDERPARAAASTSSQVRL